MILLIDHDSDERTAIENEIKSAYPGCDVLSVASCAEAMSLSATQTIDVCFMDPMTRRNSCRTLIEHLRERYRDVRINFLADTPEFALMGWQLNINDYLMRPITKESVMHAKRKAEEFAPMN